MAHDDDQASMIVGCSGINMSKGTKGKVWRKAGWETEKFG